MRRREWERLLDLLDKASSDVAGDIDAENVIDDAWLYVARRLGG